MKAKTVLVHIDRSVYLSRSGHRCWVCCIKKLFSTCWVKILEKYLWRCTFFSNVACWRPATLLKLTSFAGYFKGFWPQTEQLQILEKLFEEHFFCRTLCADFSIFQIIYENFESISILFWHPTTQQMSGIACCFLSAEEDSPRNLCLYLTVKK